MKVFNINNIYGVKFSTNLIPTTNKNRPGVKIKPKHITIHETGNTAPGSNSKAHANYIKNLKTKVSWHFTVDENEIIQHMPIDELAYHSGTITGNHSSISIELCVNKGSNFNLTKQNAYKLIYFLEKETGITSIKPHNYWYKKTYCPKNINKYGWNRFISDYENYKLKLVDSSIVKELIEVKEMIDKIIRKVV